MIVRAFACLERNEGRILEELETLLPRAKPVAVVPGLVRVEDPSLDPQLAVAPPLHPVFARAELTVWGEARGPDEIADAVAAALEDPAEAPALHVWAQAGEDERRRRTEEAKRLEKALRRALGGGVRSKIAAAVGQDVIDVVLVEDALIVYGAHRRTRAMSAFPGGLRRLAARPEAPSRAHLKLEEGLEWAELPLRPGDVAVDVGCAPGGWSWALLARGLVVHGVDPTPVAAALVRRAGFHPHAVPVARFHTEKARGARFLFCDMNGPPRDALEQVLGIVPKLRALEAIFHTVKLSDDPPLAAVAEAKARIAAAGFPDVRVRHLYHNREEITLVARREAAP